MSQPATKTITLPLFYDGQYRPTCMQKCGEAQCQFLRQVGWSPNYVCNYDDTALDHYGHDVMDYIQPSDKCPLHKETAE